jgi:hypothetical protein
MQVSCHFATFLGAIKRISAFGYHLIDVLRCSVHVVVPICIPALFCNLAQDNQRKRKLVSGQRFRDDIQYAIDLK